MDDISSEQPSTRNDDGEPEAKLTGRNTPTTKPASASHLTPDQIAFAQAQARMAAAAAADRPTEETDDEQDPDAGEAFPLVPTVEGEILVPASRLDVSRHHPRRGSRRVSDHASALALSAAEPLKLRPLVVIRKDDGTYAVIDGRFRLEAIKDAHRGNRDVEVRCVLFQGTEAEAVAQLCDEGLGTVGMTQIEQARALFSLQQTSNVSQTEIAKRYPRLTVSKVNNMVRAARVWDQWPDLFDVLQDPDRVSVDYGVKLFTLMKRLDAGEQEALLDRARDIIANGEHFTPNEALKALQVDDEEGDANAAETSGGGNPAEEEQEAEDVFGADDQPLGKAEQLAGDRLRLTLPSIGEIEAMSASEREENAAPFIARIRQHFGLEEER